MISRKNQVVRFAVHAAAQNESIDRTAAGVKAMEETVCRNFEFGSRQSGPRFQNPKSENNRSCDYDCYVHPTSTCDCRAGGLAKRPGTAALV